MNGRVCALAAAAIGSALIACGGDDSSRAGSGKSLGATQFDQPANTPLSQLSPSDALAACRTAADTVSKAVADPDLVRFKCTILGVLVGSSSAGFDVAKCKQQLAACVASPTHDGSGLDSQRIACDPSAVSMQFAGCEATVADMQACLNASLSAIGSKIGTITCESAASASQPLGPYQSLPSLAGGASNVQTVQECAPLADKCPAFDLGDTSPANGCGDTCATAKNGVCEDGRGGSKSLSCGLGTDCTDCGVLPNEQD